MSGGAGGVRKLEIPLRHGVHNGLGLWGLRWLEGVGPTGFRGSANRAAERNRLHCGCRRKLSADVAQSTGWSAESDPRIKSYALRQDSLLICVGS